MARKRQRIDTLIARERRAGKNRARAMKTALSTGSKSKTNTSTYHRSGKKAKKRSYHN